MTAQVRLPKGGKKWPRTITVGSASVKIYEVAQATFASGKAYVLTWTTPEGRKQQKFADPDAAVLEGKIKAGKLATGQTEAAGMSRSDREELAAARRIVGDTPLLAALREWERARNLTHGHVVLAAEAWARQNGGGDVKRIKVGDAIDTFIRLKERAGRQAERTYRSKLNPLRERFPESYLDELTAAQLTAYLESYQDGVTRNDFRKRAVALWRWAQKSGYIPRGAPLEIEATERATETPTDIGTITPDTYRRALEFIRAKHPQHLAPLVLAGFCGMRQDEIQGKRHAPGKGQIWEDIDLAAGHLNVTVAKKNTPAWRLVDLPQAAVEWLLLSEDRKGPVCEPMAAVKIRAILKEAGFELPENCFRHSAISYRIAVTANKPATATWAGNSVAEIDRRYRRPMTKAAGEEWFSIRPGTGCVITMEAAHA